MQGRNTGEGHGAGLEMRGWLHPVALGADNRVEQCDSLSLSSRWAPSCSQCLCLSRELELTVPGLLYSLKAV